MTMPLQSRAGFSVRCPQRISVEGRFSRRARQLESRAPGSAVRAAHACIFTYRFNFITARFRNEKVTRLSVVDSARLES